MSAHSAKTAPEILRALEMQDLLARRLREDYQESRHRRIAKIARFWERRRVLAKFVAIGAGASVAIALLIPPRYMSTTRLMPPDPSVGPGIAFLTGIVGKMGATLGSLGGDLLGMNTSTDLFAAILDSRTVQDELISKFDLRHVYGKKRWVDTRKQLSRRTDISLDRKSGVLTIKVTDTDPKRASDLAHEYVAQLNDLVTRLNTSSAHRERVFLEERLTEVKSELESSEKDFSQFASKNGAIDIKEQGKAMVEAAALLEGQLIAAQTELQGLRQIYTDQNVRVRAAQARIDELRRQLRKMGGKTESLEATPAKDDELYPSIRKLPLLGVTYADLYRRMKVEEAVFETLTQQYEIAKVQEAKEVPSVKVLDAAEIPERKVFPPRTILVLLGTLLAFSAGLSLINVTDQWHQTDPQDPGKLLVLNMVQSLNPTPRYEALQKSGVFGRVKKLFDRFRREAAPS